jgi:hypothetical protein
MAMRYKSLTTWTNKTLVFSLAKLFLKAQMVLIDFKNVLSLFVVLMIRYLVAEFGIYWVFSDCEGGREGRKY